jgi:type II secretory pathway pseudopilin PulG
MTSINLTNSSGICGNAAPRPARRRRDSEGGYTLVALLLVMSLLALWAVAAAENVRQQGQREREKEAMFRGEQVADAIRSYYRFRGAQG